MALKNYKVTIELDTMEVNVRASSASQARKKALHRLQGRQIKNMVRRSWPENRRCIYSEEL